MKWVIALSLLNILACATYEAVHLKHQRHFPKHAQTPAHLVPSPTVEDGEVLQ